MTLTISAKQKLDDWLEDQGFALPYFLQTRSGGDINDVFSVHTACGKRIFLKHQAQAPEHFFQAEAQGLAAIKETSSVATPTVLAVFDELLLLEYIDVALPRPHNWNQFGAELALLHSVPQTCFGFRGDNFCGRTPQLNRQFQCGYTFFYRMRLKYQGELALQNQLLSAEDYDSIVTFGEKLKQLVPEQDPALLHGDLWRGNVVFNLKGKPYLIDPACYWGWPEAELAMTMLFGEFPTSFYESYQSTHALDPGWRERAPIYNLYHLLNHLNLFGRAYYSQVASILKRYV